MKLSIVSPDGLVFEEEVAGFVFNSRTGQKTILDDHIESLLFFDFTPLTVLSEQGTAPFYIASGYVHILNNETKVIAKIVSTDEEDARTRYAQTSQHMDVRQDDE